MKPFEYGKESQERDIQKVREQGVLQALFFDKNMLPGTPAEPELEHEEVTEPKIIPLEDVRRNFNMSRIPLLRLF